nr:beta-lactamase family protein [Chloroflexia bacterium]
MDNRDGVLIPNLRLTQRVVTSASLVLAGSVASLAVTRGANAGHLYQLASPVAGSTAGDLMAIVQCVMDECDLRAVILHVAVDGEELVTGALGESMTGVPATTDMRFRNGALAISLVATLMLTLVDDGTIGLDDPIGTWLPDLPDAGTATFRMLANMTAGYRDYVQNPDFIDVLRDDPFRHFSTEDLIGYSLIQPRLFAPGANWEYSHTNYVILGLALEAATGEPVEQLMQERVLDPLGLGNTVNSATAAIHEPVLHAFTSEHREWLGIEPGKRFYEESTYWNPS